MRLRHRAAMLCLLALGGCTNHPTLPTELTAFRIAFVGNPPLGTAEQPLPFSATELSTFTINIDACSQSCNVDSWVTDTSYNGWAQVTVQPTGKLDGEPVLVELKNGSVQGVKVGLRMARGPVRLVVMDPGYVPAADPAKANCNNNADADHDGFYGGVDLGCFNSASDNEAGGTNATGATPLIFFANPHIYDVVHPGAKMGDDSQMKGLRATVDRGMMLVTRVSTDGLFVTDFDGVQWDAASSGWKLATKNMFFRSAFSYNYSKPRNVSEGDCLVQLDGTVQPFYGFTELNMPTWKLGDDVFCLGLAYNAGLTACDPSITDIKTIDDCRAKITSLADTPSDLTASLVDLPNGTQVSIWDTGKPEGFTLAKRFESSLVQISGADMFTSYVACDVNGNGTIDYSIPAEATCADNCNADVGCVVAESYTRYHEWKISFTDGTGVKRAINVSVSGAIADWDPLTAYNSYKGKTPKRLSKFVGTMRYFSPGSPPWTLEARRNSDCPDCKY